MELVFTRSRRQGAMLFVGLSGSRSLHCSMSFMMKFSRMARLGSVAVCAGWGKRLNNAMRRKSFNVHIPMLKLQVYKIF